MTSLSNRYCPTCGGAFHGEGFGPLPGERYCSERCWAAMEQRMDDYYTAAKNNRHDIEGTGFIRELFASIRNRRTL